MEKARIICLMGPTASGKTPLAVRLTQEFPVEIISVDSAMIYRGMDIGTAKPNAATLKIAPHRLIDIVDPADNYSAGQFRQDALQAITDIIANNKIPLLVGGTMLYFKVLQQGLAVLPAANQSIRRQLQEEASLFGWEKLHAQLAKVDPDIANKIHPNDSQRIQRALEVYLLTQQPISVWQRESTNPLVNYQVENIVLMPDDRAALHHRITERFKAMLAAGLVDEVRALFARDDLHANLPALRSVGYRQIWDYLTNYESYATMCEKAIAATRQLAKRQMTWLRTWTDAIYFNSEQDHLYKKIIAYLF